MAPAPVGGARAQHHAVAERPNQSGGWAVLPARHVRAARLPPRCTECVVDTAQPTESFRGSLLSHRGRTGLTQHDLAVRAGVSRRSVQDWESGVTLPAAERLQALIRALLEVGGLSAGREADEAEALWAAVERAAPRMHT